MRVISSVSTKLPAVALTFDDGPHETFTEKFIELFVQEDVRATFFEIGNNVKKHPGLVRKLVDAGHEVGNHSMSHPHFFQLAPEEIREQVIGTQKVIEDAAGVAPVVFRAPYLDQDERVEKILDELGLPSIGANHRTDDWNEEVTPGQIVIRSTTNLKPGDIVVLHTWQSKTLEGMPEILRRIKAQGLECVTVSELMAGGEV